MVISSFGPFDRRTEACSRLRYFTSKRQPAVGISLTRSWTRLGQELVVANTAPFNRTGHPTISVPAGTVDGPPVGRMHMLVGSRFDDATALDAASAVEAAIADG